MRYGKPGKPKRREVAIGTSSAKRKEEPSGISKTPSQAEAETKEELTMKCAICGEKIKGGEQP